MNNIKYYDSGIDSLMLSSPKQDVKDFYLTYYKYANNAGGYWVHGLWLAPTNGNTSTYSWPWELGVTSGGLKDYNGGFARWGYIYDGDNKNITNGMVKEFSNVSWNEFGIAVTIWSNDSNYIDDNGLNCVDFGDNPITIEFLDDRFDNFNWVTANGSIYELSDDKRIMTIKRVGPSHIVCYSNNEDKTIETIRTKLSDVIVNLKGLEYHTHAYIKEQSDNVECWDGYFGSEKIYHKDKTVENCLIKYYQGYEYTKENESGETINTGIYVIPNKNPEVTNFDFYKSSYVYPEATELINLNDYGINNLRLEMDAINSDTYVDWINSFLENNPLYKDGMFNPSNQYLGGFCIRNTKDKPVKVIVHYQGSEFIDGYDYSELDYLLSNGKITQEYTNINYIQIIFKENENGVNYMVSTALKSFQNFKGNLEIIHLDKNGERKNAIDVNFGFKPIQLNATFSSCQIPIVKREWIDWSRTKNLCYAFDMSDKIEEIQSQPNDEIFLYPHNVELLLATLAEEETPNWCYKWPCFYDETKKSINEDYSIRQAFCRCQSLIKIEPIINVKYLPTKDFVYWSFYNQNTPLQNLTYVKIKGINNFDWHFDDGNIYIPNLNEECIRFLFENAEDLVGTPYDESNTLPENVFEDTPDLKWDFVNVRNSYSKDGLKLYCPIEWSDKITDDMVASINQKGWTVYINNIEKIV